MILALSGPALRCAGARILARGMHVQLRDGGLHQRRVVIESDNVDQARAAHGRPAYQAALAALTCAERDIRIIGGA